MIITMVAILGLIVVVFDLFLLFYSFLEDRRVKKKIWGLIDKIEEDIQKGLDELEDQE